MKYFDKIYFINLDRRPDRLELITKQLESIGIEAERISAVDGSLLDPDPKIGNGWNHKGVAGCALSHRKIVSLAKEAGYKNFLVIEDDTIFDSDFNKKIDFYMSQIPKDWDMIYFGGNHLGSSLKPINTNVGRCSHTLTTNMYAMKNTLYDVVLENISETVDGLKMPVDVLYTIIQKQYKCYSFRPHLAWQDSIFSDIENKSQDLPFLRPNVPKISLIISSCNQIERLSFSLKSAILQDYYNYEIIVADDNSNDGTHEMIRQKFPGIKLSVNPDSKRGVYTLAQNWNAAANMATGERLIFTNADCIFPKQFVKSHADNIMFNDIIFGPNERTDENISLYISEDLSVKELMEKYTKVSTVGKDLRHDQSAYTYNQEFNFYYPWGNNFSVPTKFFKLAGGFPLLREYGDEEILLVRKLVEKFKLKVKSNKNTLNIHLWHPEVNKREKDKTVMDHFNEFEEYLKQ
jgi:GR25 family glycosyltransferase involved in LPS biosynthesis